MSRTSSSRPRLAGAIVATATLLGMVAFPDAVSAQTARAESSGPSSTGVYIVQLLEAPVATYGGGVAGIASTRPAEGAKVDAQSADVTSYRGYLAARQEATAQQVGAQVLYRYTYAFNGFAARMSSSAAAQLRRAPGVVRVTPDTLRKLDTWVTPGFLGLDDPANGLWAKAGGVGKAGEGVVVGVLDSGIWPENASFSDRDAGGKPVYSPPPKGWTGTCVKGERFKKADCNNKLIGARYYNEGFGGGAGVKDLFPYEFVSARDADGHGSHTSSTAAGNNAVAAKVKGFPTRSISGMAPRARVAMYKVCWGRTEPGAGCFTSDSIAAIDQAVADGVDVINYSIGGSSTDFLDPVEVAYLSAAAAGVFVAASAGNAGPDGGTVDHGGPWLTTVGAGYHDHTWPATVTLAGGPQPLTASGLSQTAPLAATPVVLAGPSAAAGASESDAELCTEGALDPAKVTGKVVVCDRGVIGRNEKSKSVLDAGGVGMILVNVEPVGLNADLHFVPAIHVDVADGEAIKDYVTANPAATAQIVTSPDFVLGPGREVVQFSSRGPLEASGDILKPDLVAPGVDIVAATSPAILGRSWDMMSGTSMSSPHLAGLGALMKQLHPKWSPMRIKSALMTTASTETKNTAEPLDGTPLDYGAGFVVPNSAADPGLVYDSRDLDWIRFLCGVQPDDVGDLCARTGAIDASDLNQASIAVGDLLDRQTITRTVTNVGPTATYKVAVAAPPGIEVVVKPTQLRLARGETASYTVELHSSTAPLGEYTFGSLTWSDGRHDVRSPLVVRPIAIRVPEELVTTSQEPTLALPVDFGFTGTLDASVRGFVKAAITADSGVPDQDGFDPNDPAAGPSAKRYDVTVAPGRAGAPGDEGHAPDNPASTSTCGSTRSTTGTWSCSTLSAATAAANEQVDITEPGQYAVFVHMPSTDPSSPVTWQFREWHLTDTDAGNVVATVPPAVAGTSGRGPARPLCTLEHRRLARRHRLLDRGAGRGHHAGDCRPRLSPSAQGFACRSARPVPDARRQVVSARAPRSLVPRSLEPEGRAPSHDAVTAVERRPRWQSRA